MKYLKIIATIGVIALSFTAYYTKEKTIENAFGAFGDPFLSIQLATSPSNGNCLTTDGTNNAWGSCGSGGSGNFASSTPWTAGYLSYIVNNSTFRGVATTSATCSGATTCDPFVVIGSSPITISSSAGGTSAYEIATTSSVAVPQLAYFTQAGGRTTLGGVATSSLAVGASLLSSGTLGAQIGGTNTSLSINTANTNTWTVLQNFNYSSSTVYSSFLTASSTFGIFGTLTVPNLTSAMLLTNGSGVFAEYAGTSCTNQFVRSISALGVATCATVGSADVSLANLTATDSTLTFSGTYNGATARTIGLNLGNANTWTALQTLRASTTQLTVSDFLQIPTATSIGGNMQGTLGFDTTSGNLVMGTTTSPNANSVVIASATTTLYAFSLASTSPDFISGGIIEMPSHPLQQVVTAVWCKVDAGTSQQIFISDGTNDGNTITCTTTGTQYAVTSNNVFTAGEQIRTEFVTKSGSPDYIVIRWMGYRVSN